MSPDTLPSWLPTDAELWLPVEPSDTRDTAEAATADLGYVLEERYRDPRAPASTWLPFHYHQVPAVTRRALARLLCGMRRPDAFPRRPFDPSVDYVRWRRGERILWPGGRSCALLVTHDVDTRHGEALIRELAELERTLAVRSAFFVCSDHYPVDIELYARLEASGFEIGSHGYDHDGRIAFLTEREREARLDAIDRRFRPRVSLAGFRSPLLGRTPGLFRGLEKRFLYDSSVPDVDLEGSGGCGTVLPYRIGSLIELPITLPMDSSLIYGGAGPRQVFERWSEKLEWIRRVGGVATAVLHAEPHLGGHPEMRRRFAGWIAGLGTDVWVTTPRRLIQHLAESRFFDPPSQGAYEGRPPVPEAAS